MTKKIKDKIFAKKMKIEDFSFDNNVADVFDDMLERSVPFYDELQRMTVEVVDRFAQSNTNVYDLGCSTGTTILKMAEKIKKNDVTFIGVDSSTAMLRLAEQKLKKCGYWDRCELQCEDLNQTLFLKNPSVVTLVLSLQFVRPIQRETLVKQVYESLSKGGCIVVIEKILANDSLVNRIFIDFYYDYKKRKGYSKMEISQKREALENILIPYRCDENVMLLRRNGFAIVETFFKWYNFAGFLGIKQ